jgi:hypothetical protein
MLRQRLRVTTSPLAAVGWLLLAIICAAAFWYGLMVLLLAFKASPTTVNTISGYRDIYDWAAGLEPADITDTVRLIAGLAGLAAFIVFGYLAWKELPRPYLTRHEVDLRDDELGVLAVEPRAIERAAEIAALQHPAVSAATGLHSVDDLTVNITVKHARDLAETLRDVQRRVASTLAVHELPALPVRVTLTGYERKTRRELQ